MPKGSDNQNELQDLVLHLNFEPQWAREKPKARKQWEEHSGRDERRERRNRGRRDERAPRKGGPREGGRREGQHQGRGRGPRQPRVRRAPVKVSFIPDRDRLGKVVKVIRQTKRAYALSDLTQRFLSDPSFVLVKLVLYDGDKDEGLSLFQCKADQAVFLDEQNCRDHAVGACLRTEYLTEETEVDPPTGNFPCVARCTLGGELLGPPNHHSYQTAVADLRQNKYASMDEARFRSKIEMVREQEVIDAWKAEQSRQVRYRHHKAPEDTPLLERREAELEIRRTLLDKQVQRTRKAIFPATHMERIANERLARSVRDAWQREHEHPFSMPLALRPALKHMHLHLFRTGKDQQWITTIQPAPLKAAAVAEIDQTLNFLQAHPGCNRKDLLQELCPDHAEDSPEATHHLSSLRWLIDRGHVIEFFDGSLAIPG